MSPAITGVAPWFGSKRRLAPRIVEALGPHKAYWEPFCGSLAVLLAKPVVRMETANDLHGDLINLCRVLQRKRHASELYGRLSGYVLHEDMFREAAERYNARGDQPAGETPDVDRAVDFMVCSWHGRNGVAGTHSYSQGFCVRYTKSGGHAAKRWQSVVESLPAWHKRLRLVTILNRDAYDILARIEDAEGVAIYCDPPYLVKGANYVHDFVDEDHVRLAEALQRFTKTRIVVSYYDHPRLAELYPGWSRQLIEVSKSLSHQCGKASPKRAVEVLLTNAKQGMLF